MRNIEGQNERFRRAFSVLTQAIEARVFPCCSLAITYRGKLVAHKALGRFTYEPSSTAASIDHLFDIASLTKVVATTAMAMILYERGVLDLEAPVTAIVPEFASGDSRRAQITLRMLLAHSSGLPSYEKLFLRVRIVRKLLECRIVFSDLVILLKEFFPHERLGRFIHDLHGLIHHIFELILLKTII